MIKELYEVRVNFTMERDEFENAIDKIRNCMRIEFKRGIAYVPVPQNAQLIITNIEDYSTAVHIEQKILNNGPVVKLVNATGLSPVDRNGLVGSNPSWSTWSIKLNERLYYASMGTQNSRTVRQND